MSHPEGLGVPTWNSRLVYPTWNIPPGIPTSPGLYGVGGGSSPLGLGPAPIPGIPALGFCGIRWDAAAWDPPHLPPPSSGSFRDIGMRLPSSGSFGDIGMRFPRSGCLRGGFGGVAPAVYPGMFVLPEGPLPDSLLPEKGREWGEFQSSCPAARNGACPPRGMGAAASGTALWIGRAWGTSLDRPSLGLIPG